MRRNQLRRSPSGNYNPRAELVWADVLIPAESSDIQQIQLDGVEPGDIVMVSPQAAFPDGLLFAGITSQVPGSFVTIQCMNVTGAPIQTGVIALHVTVM